MDWQKIKKDLLLASFAHFIYKIAGYLVLTILTRYLTKGDMGEFFFAASLASFFALITQLGTDNYLIRVTAQKPQNTLNNFSQVLSVRLIFFVLYLFLLNGFALIFKHEVADTVFLTSIYVLLEQFYSTFGALFIGIKKIKYNVIAGIGTRIVLVFLIYLIVRLHGSLASIIVCYIGANALLLGIALTIMIKKVGKFKLIWDFDQLREVIRLSFPFFVLSALILIHFKIDSLMLGFIKSYSEVAVYEAAYKLFEASHFLTIPLAMIFFPVFSNMAIQENWKEIRRVINKILIIMVAIGSLLAFVVLLFSNIIIPFVFGSKYNESIAVLRILYLTVPVLYVVNITTTLAKSLSLEKKAIKVMLVCTVLNIGLNSIAIPIWGAMGAAWATLITESILALLLIRLNTHELDIHLSKEPVTYLKEQLDHAG